MRQTLKERTEKKKERKKRGHKKAREGKKSLSQRWTAVCDRHPGADMDVGVGTQSENKRNKIREKQGNRKNKQNTSYEKVWGTEKKSISFGATPEGHCSLKCFFFSLKYLWNTHITVWQ